MEKHYYELPIQFESIIDRDPVTRRPKRDLPTCDLKKSIAQNIYLIITSKFNEHRYDGSYGCELWDMDFELIASENMWLDRIRKSVMKSVLTHEIRLDNISVELDITLDDQVISLNNTRTVKKRLTIYVNGTVKETGEPLPFTTNIFLSPLSLD